MENINYEKIEKTARLKNILQKTITYLWLGIWAIIVLFPFYWMVLTSLKGYSTYNSEYIPKFFTLSPTIENYIFACT